MRPEMKLELERGKPYDKAILNINEGGKDEFWRFRPVPVPPRANVWLIASSCPPGVRQ